MSPPIEAVVLFFIYLAGARATFWALSRADWPKTMLWTCGKDASDHHSHTDRSYGREPCIQKRDFPTSRLRREVTAYAWPVVGSVMAVVVLVALWCKGVHLIVTEPITTSHERRERRMELENQVSIAEAADKRAEAEQTAAQAGPVVYHDWTEPTPEVR
jgi:hypothetical protein